MKVVIKIWMCIVLIVASWLPQNARSFELTDSLQVSLLTCGPGSTIYDAYGHTALRVHNLTRGTDYVFNYGVYDFDAPNFVWRFVQGKTDYMLGVSLFDRFVERYENEGRYIDEQRLNLTNDEKRHLWLLLLNNWSDEDWTYRYNYFNDNCTTRALLMLEQSLHAPIVWNENATETPKSFRAVLHEFAKESNPWGCLAQDLLLGKKADDSIRFQQLLFSPIYTSQCLESASTIDPVTGKKRMLVEQTSCLTSITMKPDSKGFPLSPIASILLLLGTTAIIVCVEQYRKRTMRIFDGILLLLWGIVGSLISLVFLTSEHPTVDSNYLVLIFNPLPLIWGIYKWWTHRKSSQLCSVYKKKRLRTLPLLVFLVACIIVAFSGQYIPLEVYIFMLIVLLRIASRWHLSRTKIQ